MDTSLPSANAASVSNLFRLSALLAEPTFALLARETLAAFEVEMLQYPWLFPGLLAGVVAARLGGRHYAVVEGEGEPAPLAKRLNHAVLASPSGGLRTLAWVKDGSWLAGKNRLLSDLSPFGDRECLVLDGSAYRACTEDDLPSRPGE